VNGDLEVRLGQTWPVPLEVELRAPAGAVTALFGPSGSGKTTVLRSIAGLHAPPRVLVRCSGETWADSESGIDRPVHRRPVGFLFQDYALFPHLTVSAQLTLALGHLPREERAARVESLLKRVRLEGLGDRRPAALSGGQQQRAALARALARDPQVLLLDEPFAAVDWALRDVLRRELVALQRALGLTVVLVTHDFEDVAKLAHHLVVLDGGRVLASGSVEELTGRNAVPGIAGLREPAVALEARVAGHDPDRQLSRLEIGALHLEVPTVSASTGSAVRVQLAAREVILARRRPEGLSLHNVLEARVLMVEPAAHEALRLVHLEVASVRLLSLVTADAVRSLGLAPGTPVLALVKAVAVEAFA
jgi:molybdate transport system ATP-binding protein